MEDMVARPREDFFPTTSLTAARLLLVSVILIAAASFATANDIYIAQSAQGADSGADCGDAHAYSFFDTGSNWGSGASQIGPGTTVHLCGTFNMSAGASGILTFQGSGSSGSPVTVQFEAGANATAPYWGAGGFIAENGKSNIVIDGSPTATPCGYVNSQDVACNGIIQATANGASLASHVGNGHGIQLSGGSNIEVRNLYCKDLFVPVRNSSSNETTAGVNNSACVWFLGTSGATVNIHNLQVANSFNGVLLAYEGSGSKLSVNNSWMTGIEVGVQEGAGNGNATVIGGSISNNDFSNMANWDSPGDANHHEFIHLYTQQSGATIGSSDSPYTIAGNYFHGTLGATMTAEIYIECDGGSSCSAPGGLFVNEFNNVVVNTDPSSDISTGAGGNTMTECEGSTCQIYNNTYYSDASYSSLNQAIHCEAGSIVSAKNNIFNGMYGAISNGGCTVTASSNLSYGLSASCGAACTTTANPLLDLTSSPPYQLTSTSSAAYQAGANLTSLGIAALDADQLGVVRPSSGLWSMGAYESLASSQGSQPVPPTGLQAVVQ